MKLKDFNLPYGTRLDWFQNKLIEHIVDGPSDDRELKIEEAFEIQVMIEMQLLGITVKKRLDFSYLLHRYGKDLGPEVIKTKKFTPARLKDILERTIKGNRYFILFSPSQQVVFLDEEMFFLAIAKDKYLPEIGTKVVISVHQVLASIGVESEWNRNYRLRNILDRTFKNRMKGINPKFTVHNPKNDMLYRVVKIPNQEIVIHTDSR